MKNNLRDLLSLIVRPKAAKYKILSDSKILPSKLVSGVDYKIICESPKRPCPLTSDEVLALTDYQIEALLELITFRALKRKIEKNQRHYQDWANGIKTKVVKSS
jgi:hypothetical protein